MSEKQQQENQYPLQPYPQKYEQPYPQQQLYPQEPQPQQETSLQYAPGSAAVDFPPGYDAAGMQPPATTQYPNYPVTGRAQAYVQPPMAGPQPMMMGGVPQGGVSNVTMVGAAGQPASTTIIVQQQQQTYNACGHIAFSCAVFWCCNPLFGIIAFALAIAAQSAGSSNDQKQAQCLGKASLWVNICGIILAVIMIVVVIVLFVVVGVGQYKNTYDYINDY